MYSGGHSFTMNADTDSSTNEKVKSTGKLSTVVTTVVVTLTVSAAIFAVVWFAVYNPDTTNYSTLPTTPSGYPVGVTSNSEPSGMAPPAANALAGYVMKYENDFTGTLLPPGWAVFTGVPGGDPGGQFGASHVSVENGVLQLATFKDPVYNDIWVTGGLCQCGLAQTYGAYFVRSRVIGNGPNEAEVLWPKANVWPPEIDFNETGGPTNATSSTVHWAPGNNIDQRHLIINMTKWHTWGVVWTPTAITYVVDGRVWGQITTNFEIPTIPMTLDFEQRTLCSLGRQCPRNPAYLDIDWVAEYSPSST